MSRKLLDNKSDPINMADYLPPILSHLKEGLTSASLSTHRISGTRRHFSLVLNWEEDHLTTTESRSVSGSDDDVLDSEEITMEELLVTNEESRKDLEKNEEIGKEIESQLKLGIKPADLMTLVQRTDGVYTIPVTCQMIPTRILIFERIRNKKNKRELWGEVPADSKLSEVLEEITEEEKIYNRSNMRVFLCPVAKSKLIPAKGEILKKRVKDVELHYGKLCLVVDTANLLL